LSLGGLETRLSKTNTNASFSFSTVIARPIGRGDLAEIASLALAMTEEFAATDEGG